MGNDLRIGGTLEVSNFASNINKPRVSSILDAMTQYFPSFPHLTPDSQPVWYGYRPVSADGVPYIGRSNKYSNLIVAAGHAMLGMSLGPATGLLVSEIAQGRNISLPMEIFNPGRHSG
jgi:D-amino-acid dehydrogenase